MNNIYNEQQAGEICKVMNEFLSDAKYYENPKIIRSLGGILLNYGRESEKAIKKMEAFVISEKRSADEILGELDERYKEAIRTKFSEDRIKKLEEIKEYILESMKKTEDEKLGDFLYNEYFRVQNDIKDIMEN